MSITLCFCTTMFNQVMVALQKTSCVSMIDNVSSFFQWRCNGMSELFRGICNAIELVQQATVLYCFFPAARTLVSRNEVFYAIMQQQKLSSLSSSWIVLVTTLSRKFQKRMNGHSSVALKRRKYNCLFIFFLYIFLIMLFLILLDLRYFPFEGTPQRSANFIFCSMADSFKQRLLLPGIFLNRIEQLMHCQKSSFENTRKLN